MPGRSLKGHVAHISTGFLRLVNLIVIAGAVATIVVMFVIEHNPSFPAGWGFILLGLVTIVAGLFGAISSGQGGCFSCHLFCLLLSSAGLAASFLIIFIQLNTVLAHLGSKLNRHDGKQLLRVEAALYFILFCCQMVILMLACLIQSCGFIDYYEDLEGQAPPQLSAKQLARQQADLERKRSKSEASSSKILAEKMKAKYGQYSNDPLYSDSDM